MNHSIQIITDSGADLTETMQKSRTIEILPMEIEINGSVRKPSTELDLKHMYHDMRHKSVYKTSQVPLEQFLSVFERYAKQHVSILYIGLSSKLSGTVSAADMAAREIRERYPDVQIEIIDSKCATIGYGRAVLAAYDMAMQGASLETIKQTVLDLTAHTEHLFTVSKLEYLVRGGRLSAAAAAIAGTLNIKPILNVDKNGELIAIEKIRGEKKLKQRMADLVAELSGGLSEQTIYIVHGDDEAAADEMIGLIRERTPVKDAVKMMIGPTIGAHSGPGTLGIVFTNPNR